MKSENNKDNAINPLASLGEEAFAFISPYLCAGAPALGEAKGLIVWNLIKIK